MPEQTYSLPDRSVSLGKTLSFAKITCQCLYDAFPKKAPSHVHRRNGQNLVLRASLYPWSSNTPPCKAVKHLFQPQCCLRSMSQAGAVLGAGEADVNITHPQPQTNPDFMEFAIRYDVTYIGNFISNSKVYIC